MAAETDWKQTARGGAIGLVAIVVIAVFLVWFFRLFSAADKSVQTATIAGGVAVFVALFTFWKERSRAIREAHRDKKIEVYSVFFDMVFSLIKNTKTEGKFDLDTDPSFRDDWMKITKGVLFYGFPEVVNAFSEFRGFEGPQAENHTMLIMKRVGKIFLSMRSDIGLSNSGLDELSIHQIYVSDDVNKIGKIGA